MKQDLTYFLPELIVSMTVLFLFLMDCLVGKGEKSQKRRIFPVIAFAGIAAMMLANKSTANMVPAYFFSDMMVFDRTSTLFKYVFGLSGLLAIVIANGSHEMEKVDKANYYTLLTALVLGMMLLANAHHLLMIYLSLEMVSLLSYILTGSLPASKRSSEASLKYVIYGGVASGIMAYGISLLYGLTGSMTLSGIAQYLQMNAVSKTFLYTSVLMIMAGFGFKVAAVPFHMWSPDVYEGAPTPFTAFLSVGPKAAGFAVLLRFFFGAMSQTVDGGFAPIKTIGIPALLGGLAVATMTLGNLAALQQKSMKRLLAYSSIAHAGYMLLALVALNAEAISGVIFYLIVYLLMNLGAFLVLIIVADQLGSEDVSVFQGLSKRGPFAVLLSIIMTVFMFSLTGIPPMAGFIGKFYLFGSVIKSGHYMLAVIGMLNSVVSLYYYIRVVKLMFFDEPTDGRNLATPLMSHASLVCALALLTIYFGIFWNGLANAVSQAKLF